MALWGKKDSVSVTGTVVLTNNSATVTGNTAAAFLSEVKPGDAIFLSTANTAPGTTTRYKVLSVANNTSLTLETAYTATTNAAATIYVQQSPKNLPTTYVGRSLANKRDVVGLNVTEAGVAANRGRGLKTPGWINYVEGSSGRSGRKNVEVLVAARSFTATAAADAADDSVAADS